MQGIVDSVSIHVGQRIIACLVGDFDRLQPHDLLVQGTHHLTGGGRGRIRGLIAFLF